MAKRKKKTNVVQNVANLPAVIKETSVTTAGKMTDSFIGALHRIPYKLNVTRSDKILMFETIDSESGYLSFPYWSFIVTSCGIATLGLIVNSPAVIIGAMLVSPLMSPITGLGLGIALNDVYLGIKSLLTIAISVIIAVLTSAAITVITSAHQVTPEILARTNPTLLDLFIALFCGIVAGFSSVRSKGQVVLGSVAPGAAIGVALMPPLCVIGFGLGYPFNPEMMWGGFLLFLTNLFAIILTTSFFYFFIYKRIDISKILEEAKSDRKQEHLFSFLGSFTLYKRLNTLKPSRRRFLYPAFLILIISYPLMSSLLFLRETESVRIHITQYLNALEGINVLRGPESLNFSRDGVNGTIIFSANKINARELENKLNENIQSNYENYISKISLVRVAGESDLSAIKPAEITFESNQNILYDALRDKYASELVKRAFELIHLRFPREAGILIDVKVLFRTNGMESIIVEYAGEKLSEESSLLLASTLKNDLKALKGEFSHLELHRISGIEVNYGCKKNSTTEESIKKLFDVMTGLQNNEFLNLTLQVHNDIKDETLEMIQSMKMEKRISFEDYKPGCYIRYKYR